MPRGEGRIPSCRLGETEESPVCDATQKYCFTPDSDEGTLIYMWSGARDGITLQAGRAPRTGMKATMALALDNSRR